jgi:hypothetical protein
MQTLLWALVALPTTVLGYVLSAIWFKSGSPASYAFIIAWPVAIYYLAYRLCQKGDNILVIRLVSFFLSELAILAIVFLFSG